MAQAKKAPAKKAPAKKQTPPTLPADAIQETTPPMPAEPQWEYRDRLYQMTSARKPLVYSIPTKHSAKVPLLYFDEEKGFQRELRYATNQKSCFVDEQEGPVTMGRIVFRDGILLVAKENPALQLLLSLYHPYT